MNRLILSFIAGNFFVWVFGRKTGRGRQQTDLAEHLPAVLSDAVTERWWLPLAPDGFGSTDSGRLRSGIAVVSQEQLVSNDFGS